MPAQSPPTIVGCPKNITLSTILNENYNMPRWGWPTFSSATSFTLNASTNILSGSQLEYGVHKVWFRVVDDSNRTSVCTFFVHITGLLYDCVPIFL